ncbi:hypothetical protein OG874_22715 [Nocardia sp. NBC_00565]|uniref:hypothetical protein n=1 Tax=Nocardia sp. NBC_00565 TaxID=2975993 RepID=UPI002E8058DE|nr:hypothetical protein [Nocardia sp. NBC_00565]WUC07730.1 hypothetical protein OG874_22715 [Nocardia sp. NBC_00565]
MYGGPVPAEDIAEPESVVGDHQQQHIRDQVALGFESGPVKAHELREDLDVVQVVRVMREPRGGVVARLVAFEPNQLHQCAFEHLHALGALDGVEARGHTGRDPLPDIGRAPAPIDGRVLVRGAIEPNTPRAQWISANAAAPGVLPGAAASR